MPDDLIGQAIVTAAAVTDATALVIAVRSGGRVVSGLIAVLLALAPLLGLIVWVTR